MLVASRTCSFGITTRRGRQSAVLSGCLLLQPSPDGSSAACTEPSWRQGLGQEAAAGGTPRLVRQLVGCLLEGWGRVVLYRSCRSSVQSWPLLRLAKLGEVALSLSLYMIEGSLYIYMHIYS